eukprot:3414619-Pleurochrysis_carterae.AAC.4
MRMRPRQSRSHFPWFKNAASAARALMVSIGSGKTCMHGGDQARCAECAPGSRASRTSSRTRGRDHGSSQAHSPDGTMERASLLYEVMPNRGTTVPG